MSPPQRAAQGLLSATLAGQRQELLCRAGLSPRKHFNEHKPNAREWPQPLAAFASRAPSLLITQCVSAGDLQAAQNPICI